MHGVSRLWPAIWQAFKFIPFPLTLISIMLHGTGLIQPLAPNNRPSNNDVLKDVGVCLPFALQMTWDTTY